MNYDYLVVGAGLYGSILAYRAHQAGKSVVVIDKRPHVGGNLYCEEIEGIQVHKYGPHIFHTSNKKTYGSFCRIECAPIPYKHRHSDRFKVFSCKIELFNSSIGHFAG